MIDVLTLINSVYLDIPISARVAYIGWFVYVAIYYFLRRFEAHNGLLKKRTLQVSNKPYTMYVLVVFSALLSVYFSKNNITYHFPVAPGFAWEFIGFSFMAVGLLYAMEARARLNGCWGGGIFNYDNPKDQRLVRSGAYATVRHPIYFGQLLMTFGTALLVNNYWFLALPILTLISNILRAKNEELDLKEKFGDEFTEYKKKSDFIIPLLW